MGIPPACAVSLSRLFIQSKDDVADTVSVQQQAEVGFGFPCACWCSLLCLIFHVRLSLVSCGVECWVTSVWCQVSWCLHCCKATLTHTCMYKEFTHKNRQTHTQMSVVHPHVCDMHTAHACTNVCMLAQTVDFIMTLVSLPPDQSSQLPLDLQERHSFLTTGEGGLCLCVCLWGGGGSDWDMSGKCHVFNTVKKGKKDIFPRCQ